MTHTSRITHHVSRITHHASRFLPLLLTLAAFALRIWRLDSVPPGWRDDELINSLVISQKVLDGDLAVYYADASGHEGLYHALNAIFLGLFGPGAVGIRLLSAILGTLAVPLTYLLGRRLFSQSAGLLAAAGLTLSFWSLMYSRIGLRHILTPLLTLAAFYFFWRGLGMKDLRLKIEDWRLAFNHQSSIFNHLLAAVFMGLGFYAYFAGRGAPLILLAFGGYLFLLDRDRFRRHWRGWALMFGAAAILALPLLVTLGRQPESEARVTELAVPLVEARVGNFEPLAKHIRVTLSIFHSDGDGEWLYNIPHRPVFGPVGATFFWAGVFIALWYAFKPFISRFTPQASRPVSGASLASAFLLLWWLAGIAPGFISVPPGSLGHTIMAQPAVFLLAALPVWLIDDLRLKIKTGAPSIFNLQSLIIFLSAVLLFGIARRDLPDYFVNWPQRGMTRFLYRADIHAVAAYLNAHPELADFGVAGLLAGPWDKLALTLDLDEATAVRPRWYNPERAILLEPAISFAGFPDVPSPYADAYVRFQDESRAGGYTLTAVEMALAESAPVCFVNGLCSVTAVYHPDSHILELGWQVGRALDLPDIPLTSNPPPPGVYAGPRLRVFGQLWDTAGAFLAGDDGLWIDPATLQPGDIFVQQHWLTPPEGSEVETAVFGLYDPLTGERILTEDGRDHLRLEIGE